LLLQGKHKLKLTEGYQVFYFFRRNEAARLNLTKGGSLLADPSGFLASVEVPARAVSKELH